MYKIKVKHYRNALTHYRAWRQMIAPMLVDGPGIMEYKFAQKAATCVWDYVCATVSAPSVDECAPNSGMTVLTLEIYEPGSPVCVYDSYARCSILDRFVKRTGKIVALKRIFDIYEDIPEAHKRLIGELISHGH